MPKPVYRQRWAWIEGMHTNRQQVIPDVEAAGFALSALADRGLLTTRQLADFQRATGLADLAWRMYWNRSALAETGGNLRALLRRAQGFAVFMHGWCSRGGVWEPLPALTCAANPRLLALVPDLNGFGNSPFLAEVPAVEQCDPQAVMRAVTLWIGLLGLRSGARARRRRKVITLVGHSTAGASLFYFQEQGWEQNEFARCAIAPVLLVDEALRKGFYEALAVETWATKAFDDLKARLTSRVIETLLGEVPDRIRGEHTRVFERTPKGTLAQTFYAIGASSAEPQLGNWHNTRVILAHDDRLLDVSQMLRVLDQLGIAPHSIEVASGDHFLFSASDQNPRLHLRNREIVVGAILYLHERCREGQRY